MTVSYRILSAVQYIPETKGAVWALLMLAFGSNLLYMAGLASLQVKQQSDLHLVIAASIMPANQQLACHFVLSLLRGSCPAPQ
jgi:hypothetical protein